MSKSGGALRRRIELASRTGPDGRGEARAALEDDFHHFRVVIRYAGGKVTATDAAALRFPYTACPSAGAQLDLLIGMGLSAVSNAVVRQTDARIHCTHMLDLAGLCIAVAARGVARRSYLCTVPDRVDGVTRPALERDGETVLEWTVRGDEILDPPPYAGHEMRAGFAGWALKNLSVDEAEAALVLRRAANISVGRQYDPSRLPHARSTGFCYSQQPDRAESAITMKDSIRDWADADLLCVEDREFLAFA